MLTKFHCRSSKACSYQHSQNSSSVLSQVVPVETLTRGLSRIKDVVCTRCREIKFPKSLLLIFNGKQVILSPQKFFKYSCHYLKYSNCARCIIIKTKTTCDIPWRVSFVAIQTAIISLSSGKFFTKYRFCKALILPMPSKSAIKSSSLSSLKSQSGPFLTTRRFRTSPKTG